MTTFLYIAAILLMLWLVLDASTREYQTAMKNQNIIKYAPKIQKKVDKIFQRNFTPLVKMIKQEEQFYKKTGKHSTKWLSAMSRLQNNEKKYGKADVGKYIPKKYKNYKFPWDKKARQQDNLPQDPSLEKELLVKLTRNWDPNNLPPGTFLAEGANPLRQITRDGIKYRLEASGKLYTPVGNI
jgi:hypothetical protein